MQGLLDTVEREFRVAGWKSPAAPVIDAVREAQKKQQQQRQQDQHFSDGASRVATQHNRSAKVEALSRSPEQQRNAGYHGSSVEVKDDTSRQSGGSERGEKVGRCSNNKARGNNSSSVHIGASTDASVLPTVQEFGDVSVVGDLRQGASRKRQRVNSGTDTDDSRVGPPSPPKRPEVAALANGEHRLKEPTRLFDEAGAGEIPSGIENVS